MSRPKRIRFDEDFVARCEPLRLPQSALSLTGMDEGDLRAQLDVLRIEHRDLDVAIEALLASPSPDQLRAARLKKRKLLLRDEIARVESRLIPDIIA